MVQAHEGNTYGHAPDLITKTINAQNTWTDEYRLPGGVGGQVMVPVTVEITGGAVVTVQARRPGEAWATDAHDLGDTAGVANGGTLLKPTSGVTWFSGWYIRAGVKTGALNGGSAVVAIGTLGE